MSARKSARTKMRAPAHSERHVQRAILQMAGACFRDVLIFAIPNGSHLGGNKLERARQMGALKGDGLKVGAPDLLALWAPGRGAFLECKRPRLGRLSAEQKAFHEMLLALNWPVATIDSVDAAYRFLIECEAPCSGRWLV